MRSSISFDDIEPHLKNTLFITGSFCCAWSWDLVSFGASHAWAGEDPMRDQIGFGNQRAPKLLVVLLLEYVIVCGLVAVLSHAVQQHREQWHAVMAVEFLPAPFFSGKLMAYLGQFSNLTSLDQVLLNLLATAFAAFLAHAVQGSYQLTFVPQVQLQLPPQLSRFPHILGDTLGFGLGVAWNVFLVELLAPDDMDYRHIIGLFGYLLVVLMIAFRLAAMLDESNSGTDPSGPSLLQRILSMLSFAFNVVCAFTMVAFIRALLCPGWVGDFACLFLLIVLAAILSALVAAVDESTTNRVPHRQQIPQQQQQDAEYGFGTCWAMDALVFVPCVWCCCPWIPLVWILAGVTPNVAVKEQWQKLIAFVLGLATSIQASGMLTTATNLLAKTMGICGKKHCEYRWAFVWLQVLIAIVSTSLLLPALAYVAPEQNETDLLRSEAVAANRGERRPLLGRVRKLLPTFSQMTSSQTNTTTKSSTKT
mmetsp:Transcript_2565/g.5464  ORF Transcript_2565/g.5464 Transcript_2565/m.5464 type:complete len:478 (+) Transcript_2565:125-1558(+)